MLTKLTFMGVLLMLPLQGETLRLMSYNVRVDHEQDANNENKWSLRSGMVISVIKNHAPTILTLQEPNEEQVKDLKEALGDKYLWIHGRASERAYDDPQNYISEQHRETQAIAFDKDRFELLDSDRFWLAPDPTKEPLQPVWNGSPFHRVTVYATLFDRVNKKAITILTAHFDHFKNEARVNSAHLIAQKALEIAQGNPFFITGDFNTWQNDGGPEVYQAFMDYQEQIIDVRQTTTNQQGPISTWVGWEYNGANEKKMEKLCPGEPSRWDQVFLSTKGIKVHSTEVDDIQFSIIWENKQKKVYPSDHRPIIVDFEITE